MRRTDRQGDTPTLTPEGLRRAQIALVNGAKAISYSQEVHLELNQMISQIVIEGRTLQMPIDVYRILRHMTSSETRNSFYEPELAWLTKDRQAHTVHFEEKAMLYRIMKIIRAA